MDPRLAAYQASKRAPWGQGPPRQSRAKIAPAVVRLPPRPPAYHNPFPTRRPGLTQAPGAQVTSPGQVEQVNIHASQRNFGNLDRIPATNSGYGVGTAGRPVQGAITTNIVSCEGKDKGKAQQ